jgi:hypothetical protein
MGLNLMSASCFVAIRIVIHCLSCFNGMLQGQLQVLPGTQVLKPLPQQAGD